MPYFLSRKEWRNPVENLMGLKKPIRRLIFLVFGKQDFTTGATQTTTSTQSQQTQQTTGGMKVVP
jgi:hypothetical protein